MTIAVYKTGGLIARSVRSATLVAEIEVEPSDAPYDLTRFARRHGGDFAEVVHDTNILEELQPA